MSESAACACWAAYRFVSLRVRSFTIRVTSVIAAATKQSSPKAGTTHQPIRERSVSQSIATHTAKLTPTTATLRHPLRDIRTTRRLGGLTGGAAAASEEAKPTNESAAGAF